MQRGSRVKEREEDKVLHVKGLRLDLCNPDFSFQERLGGPVSQRTDQFRPDHLNLLHQEWLAGINLINLGVAIIRRSAFDDVRNVDFVPREPGRLQEIVQELSRCADKRFSLLIFMKPRRLADEHDACMRIAHTKHDLSPPEFGEFAPLAVVERFCKFLEAHNRRCERLFDRGHLRGRQRACQ